MWHGLCRICMATAIFCRQKSETWSTVHLMTNFSAAFINVTSIDTWSCPSGPGSLTPQCRTVDLLICSACVFLGDVLDPLSVVFELYIMAPQVSARGRSSARRTSGEDQSLVTCWTQELYNSSSVLHTQISAPVGRPLVCYRPYTCVDSVGMVDSLCCKVGFPLFFSLYLISEQFFFWISLFSSEDDRFCFEDFLPTFKFVPPSKDADATSFVGPSLTSFWMDTNVFYLESAG